MARRNGDNRGPIPGSRLTGPAAGRSRLGPFAHRPFAVYWGGGVLSQLGTWLQTVAGAVYVYQLTGSAFLVGVLGFAAYIPAILFSVHGGLIADRWDRRRVVTVASVGSLAMAAVLAVLALTGRAEAWHVMLVAFGLNASWSLAKPSAVALLPRLVPAPLVGEAVALNSLQFITGQILGPLLASLILAVATAGVAFAINAVTFVGPVLVMAYIARRGIGAGTGAGGPRTEGPGGAAYVRGHPWVPAALAAVVAFAAPIELVRTLAPAIVSEGLGEPESTAGVLVAATSVGSAITLLLFPRFRRLRVTRQAAVAGLGLQATGLVLTAAAGTLPLAVLGVGLVGAGFSFGFNETTASLQERVPDRLRGRIMSYHQVAFVGSRPVVALTGGAAAALATAQAAALTGLVLVPLGILGLRAAWDRLGGTRPGEAAVDGEEPDPAA